MKTTPKQSKSRAGIASQLVIDTPPAELLAPMARKVADARLTKKQRDFAQLVADGKPKATAYREAYDSKGNTNTVKCNAQKVYNATHVQQTIEALKRAKELAESLSAAQIRALILSDLLKHSQDEDQKLSDRLAALKLLGTLSDVAAYTERKEVLNVKASVDIKQQLIEKLKFIGAGTTESPKPAANSDDADSLMRELHDAPATIEGELIESEPSSFEPEAFSDKPEANDAKGA